MSEQLKHIFDISKCPTKRQMQDYLNGTMQPEEIYAFEHHISSCILCSEAMDGMMEHEEAALAGMSELNDNFLKDHLELHPPHIHLNGIAATAAVDMGEKKAKSLNVWKPVGIAATLLLCLGLGWYFKNTSSQITKQTAAIAQAKEENKITQPISTPEKKDKQTAPSAINPLAASPETIDIPSPQPVTESGNREPVAAAPQNEKTGNEESVKATDNKREMTDYKMMNTNDVASLSGGTYQQKAGNGVSIGGARTSGTLYIANDDLIDKSEREKEMATKRMNEANVLFENGEYSQALAEYKKQINSSDVKKSDQAKLMAARCYLNLGQKKNALKLLSALAEEGRGAPKRQAKKLLREIEREE